MQFFKAREEESSHNLSSEIAELKETFKSQIDRLESALKQKEASTASETRGAEEIETGLKEEINTLEGRLREKEELLETRNVELRDIQSKMDVLMNRTTQMESTFKEAEASASSATQRAEEIEKSLRAEVSTLEGRLREKEKLLEVHGKELGGFRLQMGSNINDGDKVVTDELERRLVEQESLLDAKEKEIEKLREQMATENKKLWSELQAKKVLLANIERDEWRAKKTSKVWKGWTGS